LLCIKTAHFGNNILTHAPSRVYTYMLVVLLEAKRCPLNKHYLQGKDSYFFFLFAPFSPHLWQQFVIDTHSIPNLGPFSNKLDVNLSCSKRNPKICTTTLHTCFVNTRTRWKAITL
jgi:hypothetical protein